MKKEFYQKIENHMLFVMQDSAHDVQHIYRVLNNALIISKHENSNININVLITACLLHDIGRAKQFEDLNLCHAEIGGRKANTFLNQLNCSNNFIDQVCKCINSHRLRKGIKPQSIEAKILYDADKIDSIGVIGIARMLMYGGAINEPLYKTNNNTILTTPTEAEVSTFFQEFNLRNSELRLYTNYGTELAKSKIEKAKQFYNNLYHELNETIKNDLISEYVK